MFFNLQTFKTRTLSAIIFAGVMLTGLLVSKATFFILFSIVYFGCWREYKNLVNKIDRNYNKKDFSHNIVIMLGWVFLAWNTNNSFIYNSFKFSAAAKWLMIVMLAAIVLHTLFNFKKFYNRHILYDALGLIYISLSIGLLISLRCVDNGLIGDTGWIIPLVLIASLWINDTMAYIVGSFIGKTPFSKISPKKTWEGTAGGAILAVTVITVCGYYIFHLTDFISLIIISSITATAGTCGDLFESKLKRLAQVKDSGNFMPGHGGFLDRFDSLLFASVFVWLYVKLFL